MKVTNIEKESYSYDIYRVTLTPKPLGKLLGKKEKTIRIKQTCNYYRFGGGYVYLYEDGSEVGNGNYIGKALDQWQRSWR